MRYDIRYVICMMNEKLHMRYNVSDMCETWYMRNYICMRFNVWKWYMIG